MNCRAVAGHAGDFSPDGMQHLLARARWDADGVRDDVRGYVAGHLGDPGAVLVAGETGDLKKGTATAGVQRRYTGTAGRIENAQVAVYLGYCAPAGHALIDRELYLPKSWTGDPERCAAAGIPQNTAFATRPQLARPMIERAAAAGVAFGWVPIRSTGTTGRCAAGWRNKTSPTSSQSPAATGCPPALAPRCGPASWAPGYRNGPGSSSRPARAPRESAITTGPGS